MELEEEDGVVVVVVVGMEEEMEGRMVEEMEVERSGVGGWCLAGQEGAWAVFAVGGLLEMEEGRKEMKERGRNGGSYIKEGKTNIIMPLKLL